MAYFTSQANENLCRKLDEEHQSTTALRADRRFQKLLIWEKDSGGNLLHMDHFGTATERARRRLARLDPERLEEEKTELGTENPF